MVLDKKKVLMTAILLKLSFIRNNYKIINHNIKYIFSEKNNLISFLLIVLLEITQLLK